MSLSAHERQELDEIQGGLAASDPRLAAMMRAFSRLAAGEAMPPAEEIRPGWLPARRRPLRVRRRARTRRGMAVARARRRPVAGHLGWIGKVPQPILALWVIMACAVICVIAVIAQG